MRLAHYAFNEMNPWAWAELLNKLGMHTQQISNPRKTDMNYVKMLERVFHFRLEDSTEHYGQGLRPKKGSRLETVLEELKEIQEKVSEMLVREEGEYFPKVFLRFDEYDIYNHLAEGEAVECPQCGEIEETEYLCDMTKLQGCDIYNCHECGKWFKQTPKPLGETNGGVDDRLDVLNDQSYEDLRESIKDWIELMEDKGFGRIIVNDRNPTDIGLDVDEILQEVERYTTYHCEIILLRDGTGSINGNVSIEAGYACDISGEYISTSDTLAERRAKVLNILEENEWYDRIGEYSFEDECMRLLGELYPTIEAMGWDNFGEKAAEAAKEFLDNL